MYAHNTDGGPIDGGPERRAREAAGSDQLRARMRIWKLSKPSSATCNQA